MPEWALWHENKPGAAGTCVHLIASTVFNYPAAVRQLCLRVRQSLERSADASQPRQPKPHPPSAGGNDTATRGTQTQLHLKAIKQMKTAGKHKWQASGWEQLTCLVIWREVISSHFYSKRHPSLGDKVPVEIFPCHFISFWSLIFIFISIWLGSDARLLLSSPSHQMTLLLQACWRTKVSATTREHA